MNEIEAVVELAERAGDEPTALATVVSVRGSAYRRPGARMLVTRSGRTAGTISGGCLESDVRERAARVIATRAPELATYDTTSPYDIVFGLGLGCNGVIRILIEPVEVGGRASFIQFLAECVRGRPPGQAVTVCSSTDETLRIGDRLLRWPNGSITSRGPSVTAMLESAFDDAPTSGAVPRRLTLDTGEVEVLVETIAPPISLVVFGAGEDAVPLATLAEEIGWRVTVIDDRPAYAVASRFGNGVHVVRVPVETIADRTRELVAPGAVSVIMTHNFLRDKEILRAVLPIGLPYVGALGPRARTTRLLDDLAIEDERFSPAGLESLHGPAGLDIGAETPEEIAVSILAEIRATLAGREGGRLRDRQFGIHEPAGVR